MFVPTYSASQYLVLFCFVVFEFPSNSYVHSISFFKWLLNLWKCDVLLRKSFVHLRSNVYCEDYMLQFLSVDSTYLLSIKRLTDVTLFRMAPAKSSNQNQNQNQDPPQPPPPPEAWQAVMAATNANTQLIMQILQERNQGNQGNQGSNQNHFATLNQFLANGPKTFSNCVEATDANDWLVDLCKHFECSNVRPEDFVKFASFQLKDQAAEWFQQYKDSRGGRVITWDEFRQDFKAHHIPQSVVESKREEFRNLKQGSLSVYDYNKLFQKLTRFA